MDMVLPTPREHVPNSAESCSSYSNGRCHGLRSMLFRISVGHARRLEARPPHSQPHALLAPGLS